VQSAGAGNFLSTSENEYILDASALPALMGFWSEIWLYYEIQAPSFLWAGLCKVIPRFTQSGPCDYSHFIPAGFGG
jgi:hypothetical protein